MQLRDTQCAIGIREIKGKHPDDVRLDGWWKNVEGQERWMSLKPIRPVLDNGYIGPDPWTRERISQMWPTYSRISALNAAKGPWYKPNYKRWVDRFRYTLHIKLIQWKVVI